MALTILCHSQKTGRSAPQWSKRGQWGCGQWQNGRQGSRSCRTPCNNSFSIYWTGLRYVTQGHGTQGEGMIMWQQLLHRCFRVICEAHKCPGCAWAVFFRLAWYMAQGIELPSLTVGMWMKMSSDDDLRRNCYFQTHVQDNISAAQALVQLNHKHVPLLNHWFCNSFLSGTTQRKVLLPAMSLRKMIQHTENW